MITVFGCGLFDATGCDTSIWDFLELFLLPTLWALGIALGVIAILVSTISLITSAGDESSFKEAKDRLQSNLIGIIVLLLILTLFNLIVNTLSGGVINPDISGGLK